MRLNAIHSPAPTLRDRIEGYAVSKVRSKVKEEIEKLIPPTIFFFLTLHLIALIRALMLKGTGIPVVSSMVILIGALTLGKAVLLADALPLVNRFPDKPLAYNVVWKTLLYFIAATIIHYLEHLYEAWR